MLCSVSWAGDIERIVIVSIDAWHPDSISRENTSNIYQIMQHGAFTLNGESTTPPKTLIAHTSLVTGLTTERNGKQDNSWSPGEPTVQASTLFQDAKNNSYRTGLFYSKQKLGYLHNPDIDAVKFSRQNALDHGFTFIKENRRSLTFLHLGGLDQAGPQSGWLSPDYLEALFYIDLELKDLTDWLQTEGNFLLILTSDHAGHGRLHGTDHPEDRRLPLIIYSDRKVFKAIQNQPFRVDQLREILQKTLNDN